VTGGGRGGGGRCEQSIRAKRIPKREREVLEFFSREEEEEERNVREEKEEGLGFIGET